MNISNNPIARDRSFSKEYSLQDNVKQLMNIIFPIKTIDLEVDGSTTAEDGAASGKVGGRDEYDNGAGVFPRQPGPKPSPNVKKAVIVMTATKDPSQNNLFG